uniref:Ribosome biogenesis protein NOP53 n=1 Tax=Strombidium rassoulzadegani TaxID=1082188 RepID=A0A7S3FY67_9SPIT|mmetsp:Transcript_9346/g.15762  ORF Transcript_9346/g.15762 Transcript_9346/m.15762 type:complete len:179 (+) Transcript_9346:798-1334(+)
MKQQYLQEQKQESHLSKQADKVEKIVRQVENEQRKSVNKQKRLEKERKLEETIQEQVGIINKPKKIGRFKYKMRKEDFQMDEDLAENLRKIKPLGNDRLLQDRFDSIFRRNLIEPDAPTQNEKKRVRKLQFKMVNKLGSKEEELYEKNLALKKKNDEKERMMKKKNQNKLAHQDIIVI